MQRPFTSLFVSATPATCPTKTNYNGVSENSYLYSVDIGPGSSGYGAWLSCDLTFTFTNDVCIYFEAFNLQTIDTKTGNCRDYVQIEAGGVTHGPYCGTVNPIPEATVLDTDATSIVVKFRSDLNSYGTGVSVVTYDCGNFSPYVCITCVHPPFLEIKLHFSDSLGLNQLELKSVCLMNF